MYAGVTAERLNEEIERLGVLKEGEAGFRKGRGAIDNIYILKGMIESEIKKKGGKVYAFFVDFTAAFDTVERMKVWEVLRKKGVRESLVRKIEELYKDMYGCVKMNGVMSEEFEIRKGLRQGCPLSATLFIAYIADMDEMFERGQEGGMVVGREKVWTLAYADDVVIVANEGKEMKGMIKRMERYVGKKGLQINLAKSKMMIFSKGGTRKKKNEWMWKGREIETVKEYKYLGYYMDERNSDKRHITERVKSATKVMGKVWSIGERKFGNDLGRRIRMFDNLVLSIIMFGAEVWGWKEYDAIEKLHERYLRWMIGVDREVPGYIVREELKRTKVRVETAKRAVKYEDRMNERSDYKLLYECWKEWGMKNKIIKEEREKWYESVGYANETIIIERAAGRWWWRELKETGKDVDKQIRRRMISESRYNSKYKELIEEEVPKYLNKYKGSDRRMIARYRCGNEERENRYWMKDSERRCRLCKEMKETIEHLLYECENLKESEKSREEILNEEGNGIEWIRMVEKERKRIMGLGQERKEKTEEEKK